MMQWLAAMLASRHVRKIHVDVVMIGQRAAQLAILISCLRLSYAASVAMEAGCVNGSEFTFRI